MGGLILKAVSHGGSEAIPSQSRSLLELTAKNIDGVDAALSDLCAGKKCIMVVNVATKWGLTDKNYKEMVQVH